MISNTQLVARLLVSLLCSGAIGLERELHKKGAGFRTHILVCLGSCLMMLTSLYIFDIYSAEVDPTRLASGIMTGIGFLGAGTILRYGEEVRGLTTAATIWLTCGIGLAVGCGFYKGAIFTTLLTLFVLMILRRIEKGVTKENGYGA